MAELDEPEQRSSGSAATSAASDVEPIVQKLSPTESPPVQVMDQSGGYGKHRIPSSVFERSKPSTTFDWSIASNESLFSIQLGDNSFSWDYSIMSSGDNMPMSGELSNSSELVPSTSQPSGDTVLPDDDSSPEKNLKANKKSVVFMLENNDSQSKEKPLNVVAVGPINSSKYSDESGASPNSFSFPILTEVNRGGPLNEDTPKYTQQSQCQLQNSPVSPTLQSSPKKYSGSWKSGCCCYWSCSSWPSCFSWLSCCSCRSCCSSGSSCSCFSSRSCRSFCSCNSFYSSFSCRFRACCC